MKTYIMQSIRIVNSQIFFVLLIAVFNVRFFPLVDLIFSVFSLLLTVGIFGYFIEIIRIGDGDLSLSQNIRTHLLNYLIVAIAIGVLTLLIRRLAGQGFREIYIVVVSTGLIKSLTVYTYPVVFIWKKNIEAFPLGVKILANNFRNSLPLFGLAFLSGFTLLLFIPLFTYISQFIEGRLLPMVISGYILGFISSYLSCVLFVTASLVLIRSPQMDLYS